VISAEIKTTFSNGYDTSYSLQELKGKSFSKILERENS
jgi:hypothetical protein